MKNQPQKSNKKVNVQNDSEKRRQEAEIDDQLEQTLPASDPPSYSQPGNNFDKRKEK